MVTQIERSFGEKFLKSIDNFYTYGIDWLFNEWWETASADVIAKYEAAILDHPELITTPELWADPGAIVGDLAIALVAARGLRAGGEAWPVAASAAAVGAGGKIAAGKPGGGKTMAAGIRPSTPHAGARRLRPASAGAEHQRGHGPCFRPARHRTVRGEWRRMLRRRAFPPE